jgi:hypothetical protein
MYLAGKQREYDLACAARLLKQLAEAGDGGAGGPEADAAVAAADSTPREVWAVLYDWLEEVESDAAALKEKLLDFLACPKRYALFAAIAFAFKDVPQLYALMQGSAARDCGAAIFEQLAGLLAFISEISEDPAALVDHAMQCLSQRLDNSAATLKGQRKPKDAAAVKRSKQQLMAEAKPFLLPVIKGAAAAFLTKRDRIDPFLAHAHASAVQCRAATSASARGEANVAVSRHDGVRRRRAPRRHRHGLRQVLQHVAHGAPSQ